MTQGRYNNTPVPTRSKWHKGSITIPQYLHGVNDTRAKNPRNYGPDMSKYGTSKFIGKDVHVLTVSVSAARFSPVSSASTSFTVSPACCCNQDW
ncbi:hypothetical protein MAR_037991 [Mya arenaria]|uniref:Uncharacterized protein n=1 Tax=Mya arenaria TaxID=6604 RepID=A0ABY7FQA4_MYAAR|nr:hypothetical protein MAR_037991 [Mya arenaria]